MNSNTTSVSVALACVLTVAAVAPSEVSLGRPMVPTIGAKPELGSPIQNRVWTEGESIGTSQLDARLELLQLIDELTQSNQSAEFEANLDGRLNAGAGTESADGSSIEDQTQSEAETVFEQDELFAKDALYAQSGSARTVRSPKKSAQKKTKQSSRKKRAVRTYAQKQSQDESRARQAVRSGDYYLASQIFFGLLERERNPRRLGQLRFLLARTLQQLDLHQVAAFPYYEIIRTEGKTNAKSSYVRQSLERLTVAADRLESEVLLSYALKQIREEDFPAANRDLLFYRRGELRLREKNYIDAAREFSRVRSDSTHYWKARYRLALSLVEAGQLEKAEAVFSAIVAANTDLSRAEGITNKIRVNALLGKARTLYQRKLFSEAIEAYRQVPRDTEQWHEALFESTWAMLLDGRFRSALSNFHSLHSPFYDDFYQPESLVLRSIVYHYICRYDEMEKVLALFDKTYQPARSQLRKALLKGVSPMQLYREIRKVDEQYDQLRRLENKQLAIPFLVSRQVLREGDVRRNLSYVRNLEDERRRIASAPKGFRDSKVGRYAARVVSRRLEATQVATGRFVRRHLERILTELGEQIEQTGLVKLDMLAGRKEQVKKEIAGKGLIRGQIEEDSDRSFYVQNGYDYWPFRGEYWLDEIGQFQYLGVKACE